MHFRKSVAVALLSLAFLPRPSLGGSVNIYPIRIALDPGARTASVKVTNGADDKVALQVEAMVWHQDADGQDKYETTSDLVFSPKILTIDTKQSRVVRLGLRAEFPAREQTYRVYLRELPRVTAEQTGLKLSLRLGVPVFVSPSKKPPKVQARIESVQMAGPRVVTRLKNDGEAHIVFEEAKVRGLDASGKEVWTKAIQSWYVLAGMTRPFAVDTTPEECRQAAKVEVTGQAGGLALSANATVDHAKCELPTPAAEPAKD